MAPVTAARPNAPTLIESIEAVGKSILAGEYKEFRPSYGAELPSVVNMSGLSA